MSNDEVL